jgi:divalent metal cation (Fe/Co/Zn/Cd) transporter
VWLAYETKGLLIGESADTEVVQSIRKIARDAGGVMHINEVLTMHMAPEYILVNLSADFADNISAADIEDNIAQLDKEIKSTDPRVKRVFVEARENALASV